MLYLYNHAGSEEAGNARQWLGLIGFCLMLVGQCELAPASQL